MTASYSSELYPTKTRLQLLADVLAGNVFDSSDRIVAVNLGHWVTVTKRIEEMQRAGWVERRGFTHWGLTDTGRAVLDGGA